MNEICPKCGAALQPQARFCPHCMSTFYEKEPLPLEKPPKNKRKRLVAVLAAVAILVCSGAGVFWWQHQKRHAPLCTFGQFSAAAERVSDRMGLDDLWDTHGFVDTHYSKEKDLRQYSTSVALDGAVLSVFFYHNGEEVYATICDVKPEMFSRAESLLKCIVQSVCNHYLTDIDQVFDDETLYPKVTLSVPFDPFFTDMMMRTDRYNADIAAGTSISTRYLSMMTDHENLIFSILCRETDNSVLYDLTLAIGKDLL